MKKIISVMVLFLASLSLMSCGSKGISQNNEMVEINSDYDILSLFTFEDGYSGTIKSSDIDNSKLGKYNVTVAVKHGKSIKDYNFNVEVVDRTKPEVETLEAKVKLNSTDYNLAEFIKVSDNSKEDLIPTFDTSGLDTSKAGSYNVNYSVKDSSGNETIGELKVDVQAYSTTYSLAEMGQKVRDIIDSQYSEVFAYSVDPYTDAMTVRFVDKVLGVNEVNTSDKYMTYYQPYMNVAEVKGHGGLILATNFIYVSANFLDYYLSKVPLIVLASNGEKWTFMLRTNKTNNDRNIYETDFSFLINVNEANYQYTDENIDTIYDLFKNGNLTFKMDKKNIEGVYPEGSFEEKYTNAVIQMIDFYKDLEEQLDWKPSANY